MLGTISSTSRKLLKLSSINSTLQFVPQATRVAWFGTSDKGSVIDAWNRSCYYEMDYTIPEDSTVYEAVERFSAYDVGALVTTDKDGKFSGIISERDYIKKMALLGRKSKETKIKDIYVHSRNVVSASVDDSVEKAMEIMMTKSIRHLPIVDGDKLVGIVSIKDLIKEVVTDREQTIRSLSDLALGKGAGAM